MYQFIEGSDAAYAELGRRARSACIVFAGETLPPGCRPATARVGFEVEPASGRARLWIDRGVTWQGAAVSPSVQSWFTTGQRDFDSFEQLRQWIQTELAGCYPDVARPAPAAPQPPLAARVPDLGQITDLSKVQVASGNSGVSMPAAELLDMLRQQVRGQDTALATLARRVTRHMARQAPRRPLTVLAVGPTGVGKTKTAAALAESLHGEEGGSAHYSFLRLDMAEYQEQHRVSQLLGAPPGYVGYGDGAQLTRALASNPRTLVLFDEIEKAHDDILRALMNAMDAGRLSAPNARTQAGWEIDCRQAVFFFTTNLDALPIQKELVARSGFEDPAVVDHVCRTRLQAAGIAPELVGRIGCFLVFQPLAGDVLAEIAALSVVTVAQEYGLEITAIEPEVLSYLLGQARGQQWGVRPYEYLADEILGDVFAAAAAGGSRGPVALGGGPPFVCRPGRQSSGT